MYCICIVFTNCFSYCIVFVLYFLVFKNTSITGGKGLGWSLSEETIGFLSWKDLSYYKSPKLSKIEVRTWANKSSPRCSEAGSEVFQAFIFMNTQSRA